VAKHARSPRKGSSKQSSKTIVFPGRPPQIEVKDWLFRLLAKKHALPTPAIVENDSLESWGLDSSPALANLASEFNREARRRSRWWGAFASPPELTTAKTIKTIGDLASVLAVKVQDTQSARPDIAEAAGQDLCNEVWEWLSGFLSHWTYSNPDTIQRKTTFKSLILDANGKNAAYIEANFYSHFGVHANPTDIVTAMRKMAGTVCDVLCRALTISHLQEAGADQ
jgi:hypothetical protein